MPYTDPSPARLLKPPRTPLKRPTLVTSFLLSDIIFKVFGLVALFLYKPFGDADVQEAGTLFPEKILILVEVQVFISCLFVEVCCRWEAQGHFITLWQVVCSLVFFCLRRSFYVYPLHYTIALTLLLGAYYVGMMAEFRQSTPPRLPPFPPKQTDIEKPRYGWLGEWVSKKIKTRATRRAIVLFLWMSYQTRTLLMLYFSTINEQDDLSDDKDRLDTLFLISTVFSALALTPNACVCLASIPELCKDCMKSKKASRAYQTGAYEVCTFDEDERPGCELKQQLTTHSCRSLTVVVPCYMPNEEEIIFDVIEYYKVQEKDYPGTMRLMIVWNSPRNHPDFEVSMANVCKEFPWISSHRNTWSTSKCDNLNMACDLLETDFCLLNDADTMVTAATMCRASMLLYDKGYDIAQSHSTHCYIDKTGQPESGCFPFGAFATLFDSTKPLNMSTQGIFSHSPFNGRGGFWRVDAVKKVGFDHRTIGEDHDAGYRAVACYGIKGTLDQNLICQEREPPDCKSLTSQRIRWETAALEMRRTFPWILRSKYYGRFEAFVLIWSQLCWNCNLPLQSMPLQMVQLYPLAISKSYLNKYVINFKTGEWVPEPHGPPVLIQALLSVIAVYLGVCFVDYLIRLCTTRYRPRIAWIIFGIIIVPFIMMPYMMYLQYWAMVDYCWGGAKFICTTRSPTMSPKGSFADLASLEAVKEDPEFKVGGGWKVDPKGVNLPGADVSLLRGK